MTRRPTLMIFSDLDGTLLDHETYDWSPAAPALAALAEMGAPVVLASSKTAPEIARLRAAMGLSHWPAIVENGAGLLPPERDDAPDCADHARLRAALETLPEALRASFEGFTDMDAARVAEVTGLPPEDAARARTRAFSEPGLWHGDDATRAAFIDALDAQGIAAVMGGRFLTLSHGADKADRLRELAQAYEPAQTVALGDAPNDIGMLSAADHGVVIANPASPEIPALPGEDAGRVTRTVDTGPLGWNSAILSLLDQLTLTES